MKEVVAMTPRFYAQILSFVSDPERMRDFITNPDNLQMMVTMGLGTWSAIKSMQSPDYMPQEVAGMLNAPGYAIPGSGPTNLAEGGFDFEGDAYSPSMPPNNPAARFRSTAPPAFSPDVNASSNNKRIARILQNELREDNDVLAQKASSVKEEMSPAPMPAWTFQDLLSRLHSYERYNQNLSDGEKVQGYKAILFEYDNSLSGLRKWLKDNGFQKTQLNNIVNETRTNK